jgi:hypothetical protein
MCPRPDLLTAMLHSNGKGLCKHGSAGVMDMQGATATRVNQQACYLPLESAH